MNKRGNLFFGAMIALILWMAGIYFLPYIIDDVTTFRVAMDCTNSSITDTTKITCLTGDIIVPYFIWTLVSLAVGYIGWKT